MAFCTFPMEGVSLASNSEVHICRMLHARLHSCAALTKLWPVVVGPNVMPFHGAQKPWSRPCFIFCIGWCVFKVLCTVFIFMCLYSSVISYSDIVHSFFWLWYLGVISDQPIRLYFSLTYLYKCFIILFKHPPMCLLLCANKNPSGCSLWDSKFNTTICM